VDGTRPLVAADIQNIAQNYLDFLDRLDATAAHVVDKMPLNFEQLGLIALCFPQATILHVERDPVDTCLSCFFQNFSADRHGYSDDLADLGRHYLYYRAMMDYWREVLPVPIQSVRYEQLVGQPESEIPALLAACGLEMEAACLSPHRTERSVRTASKTQVREPIHRASVQKWRRYEQELLPLLAVLREGGVAV
ncbi:MAG: sulfotransferase, partial [Azospira sp.]|nr:sulfotransferase [Azospira sp.]